MTIGETIALGALVLFFGLVASIAVIGVIFILSLYPLNRLGVYEAENPSQYDEVERSRVAWIVLLSVSTVLGSCYALGRLAEVYVL